MNTQDIFKYIVFICEITSSFAYITCFYIFFTEYSMVSTLLLLWSVSGFVCAMCIFLHIHITIIALIMRSILYFIFIGLCVFSTAYFKLNVSIISYWSIHIFLYYFALRKHEHEEAYPV